MKVIELFGNKIGQVKLNTLLFNCLFRMINIIPMNHNSLASRIVELSDGVTCICRRRVDSMSMQSTQHNVTLTKTMAICDSF